MLNVITAPAPAPVEAPELEQEYIDLAFAAIIKKMKKTLNDNEIMENIFEMLQPVSTNQQMGIGPTGPIAVPVNYNDNQFPQHLQF